MSLTRLDLALLERKLVSTRSKAQELIKEGKVTVDGKVCARPGERVGSGNEITLLSPEHPYVSRGGLKLEAALKIFTISVKGKRVLDIGQSTGGFTQCLLDAGAKSVVGIEVGHGQLAPCLKEDPRVQCLERQDIRALNPEAVSPAFVLGVCDLSFISLALVIPHLRPFLTPGADLILLVKPQFEVGPENVGAGGIVRKPAMREKALKKVEEICRQSGFTVAGVSESPIEGGDGNREYLLHLLLPSS